MSQALKMVMEMDEQGRIAINVTGPGAENSVLLLGLIERVKLKIEKTFDQPAPASPPLLLANGSLPIPRRS